MVYYVAEGKVSQSWSARVGSLFVFHCDAASVQCSAATFSSAGCLWKKSNELNFCINRAKKIFRIKDPSASALMVFKPWVSGVSEWVSGVPLFMQQFISIHLHDNGATGDCRCTCDWCCGIVAVQQKGPDWLQKQIMRKGPRLESRKMSFLSFFFFFFEVAENSCEGKKTKMQPDELSGRRS